MPDIYVAPSAKKKPSPKMKPKAHHPLEEKEPRRFENLVKGVIGETSKSPLSALVASPNNISFETQGSDEEIVLLLRRHWIVNIPGMLLIVLLILAPLCLSFFPLLSFLPSRFRVIAIIMWYLFILSFLFEKFLWWFFNVYIITDRRVIDIDFHSLVYKEISEAELEKIQDITYKTGGFMSALFDFGTVFIQTAATEAQIEFEDILQPAKVVKILGKLTRGV